MLHKCCNSLKYKWTKIGKQLGKFSSAEDGCKQKYLQKFSGEVLFVCCDALMLWGCLQEVDECVLCLYRLWLCLIFAFCCICFFQSILKHVCKT